MIHFLYYWPETLDCTLSHTNFLTLPPPPPNPIFKNSLHRQFIHINYVVSRWSTGNRECKRGHRGRGFECTWHRAASLRGVQIVHYNEPPQTTPSAITTYANINRWKRFDQFFVWFISFILDRKRFIALSVRQTSSPSAPQPGIWIYEA